ncbi:hypothetical protein BW686_15975 [Pseudomonas syringae]|uniref:Uncharacterized protein n=1 Tax=Pseudomonas syringae TaxID=317 RepID=A0A244EQ53_PSESX|nr:hypothetical protein BW686_15975 [Pseudomonas syringae]
MRFNRNRSPVIGLGNGVTINCASCRLAWRTLGLCSPAQLATDTVGTETSPVSQTWLTTGQNPALQLFDERADMGQWRDDTFDMLIIHLPLDGSTSETYRHLIRVARQGVIILS